MSLQSSSTACLKLRSSATRLTSAKSSPALLHPASSSSLHCMRRAPICAASRCCSGTDPGCSTNLQAHEGRFSGSYNRHVLSEAANLGQGQPYAWGSQGSKADATSARGTLCKYHCAAVRLPEWLQKSLGRCHRQTWRAAETCGGLHPGACS